MILTNIVRGVTDTAHPIRYADLTISRPQTAAEILDDPDADTSYLVRLYPELDGDLRVGSIYNGPCRRIAHDSDLGRRLIAFAMMHCLDEVSA